jgi:hypothetical protein
MTPANHRPRGAAHSTAREARARRSFDAVLASYIRELSTAGPDNVERPGAKPGRSLLPLHSSC